MDDLRKIKDFYCSWAQGTALYARWANNQGIGYPEFMVLYALNISDKLTQKAISEGYGLPKQTVNTVIRNLKKNDYITLELSQKDKREKTFTLTDKGKEYSSKIITPVFDIEKRIYENIGYELITQMKETVDLFNILFEKELERNEKNK